MEKALQPQSLELKVDWNGDVTYPVAVRIIVQVQAKSNSFLTILKNFEELDLSDSFLWKISYVDQEVSHLDPNEPVDLLDLQGDSHQLVQKRLPPKSDKSAEDTSTGKEFEAPTQDEDSDMASNEISGQNLNSDGGGIVPSPEKRKVAKPQSDIAQRESSFKNTAIGNTKPSRIPIRRFDLDGSSDGADLHPSSSGSGNMHDSVLYDFDFDMPPSPTPSSQDLIPWTSTKEIVSRMEEDEKDYSAEEACEEKQTSLATNSEIRREDGNLVLYIYGNKRDGYYQAEVISHQFLSEEKEGLYILDLSDIITACPPIPGDIVFDLPLDSGFEHNINGVDVYQSEGCLRSHFDPRERPFVLIQLRELTGSGEDSLKGDATELLRVEDKYNVQEDYNSIQDIDITSTERQRHPISEKSAVPSPNELRHRIITTYKWLLPTVFIFIVAVCALTGGPPEAIATPGDTFHTLRHYAVQYPLPRAESAAAAAAAEEEAVYTKEESLYEGTSSVMVSTSEAPTASTTECQSVDQTVHIHSTTVSSAEGSHGIELRKNRDNNRGNFRTWISSLAWDLLSHIACSTSTACILTLVEDKYEPPWAIFERFYCGENGDWRPTTNRDKFDHFLGWTPPECLENI